MRIAIIDFQAQDIPEKDAVKVTELIRSDLVNIGKFTVIERAQMGEVLKEQKLQMTGCTDVSCAVEIGKLLSARKILVGTVMQLGNNIIITGRIVDVEKGVAEFSRKEIAASKDDLFNTVSIFVQKLSESIESKTDIVIKEKEISKEEKTKEEIKEQVKEEVKEVKKEDKFKFSNPFSLPVFGLFSMGMASLGGGYYFNMQVDKLNSDYEKLYRKYKSSTASTEATGLHDRMKSNREEADKSALYRNIFYSIGGAAILGSAYYFYRYMNYSPENISAHYNKRTVEFIPFLNAGSDLSYVNNRNRWNHFSAGIILRI